MCNNPALRLFQTALRSWMSARFKKGSAHRPVLDANYVVLRFHWCDAEGQELESLSARSGFWHVSCCNKTTWELGLTKFVQEAPWHPRTQESRVRGRTALRACDGYDSEVSFAERAGKQWPSCLGQGNAAQAQYAPPDGDWECSCRLGLWKLVGDDGEWLPELIPSH